MTAEQTSSELPHNLIMMALSKIDQLAQSNTELAKSITKLDVVISNLEINWEGLKKEISETRHDAVNKYFSLDARVVSLEKDQSARATTIKLIKNLGGISVAVAGILGALKLPWKYIFDSAISLF